MNNSLGWIVGILLFLAFCRMGISAHDAQLNDCIDHYGTPQACGDVYN